jgi:large subunit ribosomal protein L9
MPKTEVILISNIVGLGAESDQVKVAAGYARNYLFPQGLAIPLTQANKRRLEVLRQRRAEREAHEFNTMNDLAGSISKLTCLVKVKTGDDGKMFGSVTAGTIADELKHQFDIALDKKKIHLEHPIRALGEYDVELRLHQDITTTLKVKVESTTPLPQPAPAPEAKEGAPPRHDRHDRRGRHAEGKGGAETKPALEGKPGAEGKAAAAGARGPRPERPARGPRPPRPARPVAAKAEPAKPEATK